jgi:ribosome-associated translation inhibitor RaiA
MFAMSGLGRGRGFSFKRIEVSPYVRELVVKKLREASQYLERVIKWVTVSLLRKTLCREVWIPLTLSCVVREYKIPIGGDVRVERG